MVWITSCSTIIWWYYMWCRFAIGNRRMITRGANQGFLSHLSLLICNVTYSRAPIVKYLVEKRIIAKVCTYNITA